MRAPTTTYGHLEITQTLVRLYIFLIQKLDRCLNNEGQSPAYPEQELEAQIASTRAEMMEILSVNRVVKEKVEQECHRVYALAAACRKDTADKATAMQVVTAARAELKTKTAALSDLLAVFRAA